jgi:hypothetical protein
VPTINLTLPVSATVITAGLHSTNYAAIQNLVNGALDNNNIAVAAGIAQSKLAFDPWSTYVPTWTSDGTAPALGNGTLVGKYAQIGKTVLVRAVLTMGSTSTFGTGNYFISLPVTAGAGETGAIGVCQAVDTGVNFYACFSSLGSTTTMSAFTTVSPAANWGATVPFTWGNTDVMRMHATYEAA